MNKEQVIAELGLLPLAGEGGFWAPINRDEFGNSIYFLITPESPSTWHILNERETWVHLAGAPMHLHSYAAGDYQSHTLAPFSFTHSLPAQTWMAAETTGEWSLALTFLAPPFSNMRLLTPAEFAQWRLTNPDIPELISPDA